MAYKLPETFESCFACNYCSPVCPTGAMVVEDGQCSIDASLCNNCEGFYPEPQCVVHCPASAPIPMQAKKGRSKAQPGIITSPDLFLNGVSSPFASAIVIWEACNLLAQRRSLPWQEKVDQVIYQRELTQGQGSITLQLHNPFMQTEAVPSLHQFINPEAQSSTSQLDKKKTLELIDALDIRAACLHLIFAAHAATLDEPWSQEFVISDRQIEQYLGLDKRKDLNKSARLTLIKTLVQQPCWIHVSLYLPQRGKLKAVYVENAPLWHLLDIRHQFQEDEAGCKHLVGLTIHLRAGIWSKYFLNRQDCKERTAFYQYGNLPKSLLNTVMSLWQQHEGAARLMLWLLFKLRIGREQRLTVPTLMRVAYGEEKVRYAAIGRDERKRLLRTFESDLEALNHYGLKPMFDPVTYPEEIQPLWAKLAALPDDAEDALEFWMNDGSQATRLTDAAPRGKWNLLMNARILGFELPSEWEQPQSRLEKRRSTRSTRSRHSAHPDKEPRHAYSSKAQQRQRTNYRTIASPAGHTVLSGQEIVVARRTQGLSQRDLAEKTGKSQSWIRDIENGRFSAKPQDQKLLRQVLCLE